MTKSQRQWISVALPLALIALGLTAPALRSAPGAARAARQSSPPATVTARLPLSRSTSAVSFHRDIRPIIEARCQGCHQPAKLSGGYLMTEFDRLKAGGGSGKPAIVPGQPDNSNLIALITPKGGKARMPIGADPLTGPQIVLIRQWISQGARNDSPVVKARFDMTRPPVYTRPPVITSMDYSPDGKLLAVAGFHEVLLMSGDGKERLARLVGPSERIESVRFSPDGTRLAVAGGAPARRGDLQIWDVATRRLLLSTPVGYDTLRGAAWSSDGKLVSFGCADNTVRAVEAETGKQVLQQGSHSDWPLDTVFSVNGANLVSVSRDQSVKLTELATQRFVDNITSITPGGLKGGVQTVARHPQRDEIVVGGSDGTPRVYRIFRQVTRVIGDDSNLIREFPALQGRLYAMRVSADGRRIAAGSSLDGKGEIGIYSYEFDTGLPESIKAIQAKVQSSRSPQENATIDAYHREGVKLIARISVAETGVYSLAIRPDGKVVAAAGADGTVRVYDLETGAAAGSFMPAPVAATPVAQSRADTRLGTRPEEPIRAISLGSAVKIQSLIASPASIQLQGPYAAAQVIVTGRTTAGEAFDVTRLVTSSLSAPIATISAAGLVQPKADGTAQLRLTLGAVSTMIPVSVSGTSKPASVDYIRDVQPVLSKLGCTAGTCHGSKEGRNGFKLSLRGYDALSDVRSLTDDLASRRVNLASPDDSLMLVKATGAVPHAGGQVCRPNDTYYKIMRAWIAAGAPLNASSPKVTGITVTPENPIVQAVGAQQQLRVIATFADGKKRDVTREAFLESGNTEVASANHSGLLTSLRRGEAPVLVRYEGAYAATTMTVMGDRSGFVWRQPPAYDRVDELVASKWKRLKIQPSELCTDADFIRRVSLDLTGLPPSSAEVSAFLADTSDSRTKRAALVDRLVGSKEYLEYWTNKWADLLQVNRKFLGLTGAVAFRKWIRERVEKNVPWDDFARQVITASGSNRENPAASYYKILRDAAPTMENTTHLFLAVRFNCNKCHDHPFERWTQDQYYHLAAYFAQVDLQGDPMSGGQSIGGTAVEGGKPLYEIVVDRKQGEIKHDRTGQVAPPSFPYPAACDSRPEMTRREQLAAWLTSPDNRYFARSFANRIWGYMFGVGIIDPIDDIRAGNPPSNPELLDLLTQDFVKSGFDVQALMKRVCKTRTYQLSVASNRWNEDDKINYSHSLARRLQAEVLFDAVHRVTGSQTRIAGVAPGTRAAELPDSGLELESGFFGTFGRPVRESACECERTAGLQLGPVMALVSGPTISNAISDPTNEIAALVAREKDDRNVIRELFLRILNRPATEAEIKATLAAFGSIAGDHQKLVAAVRQREVEAATLREKAERERQSAMAAAQQAIADYQKEIAPRVAEAERVRAERIAALEAELRTYEGTLGVRLSEWEKRQNTAVQWQALSPTQLTATGGTKLEARPDFSIIASGPQQRGTYTIVARTNLKGITALRLEALPDPAFPQQGPGRAPDGNFVLSEIDVTTAPASDPSKVAKVVLQTALADFSQENFAVQKAIDGSVNPNDGWASSPILGIPHWATFETREPIGTDGETIVTITLHHQFSSPQFGLGRFRLSVAAAPRPVGLSLPQAFQDTLRTPVADRDPARVQDLLGYFRVMDAGYRQRQVALAESRRPLAEDPKLTELKEQYALASKPVPEDGRLAQLRNDVLISEKQLAEQRLTGAQDLAWALINSPAFLFNR